VKFLRTLVIVLLPLIIIVAPIRAAMMPWIVPFEYALPGFPDDGVNIVYPGKGMKPAERLRLGLEGLEGVAGARGIQVLREAKFDNGQLAFNEREVEHLDDVRKLINVLFPLHTVAVIAALVAGAILWRANRAAVGAALRGGGIATLALIVGVIAFALIGWDTFFVTFHRLFFSGETWLFNWDDTLIRLYPVEFWQIAVGGIAACVLVLCLLAIWLGKKLTPIA